MEFSAVVKFGRGGNERNFNTARGRLNLNATKFGQ